MDSESGEGDSVALELRRLKLETVRIGGLLPALEGMPRVPICNPSLKDGGDIHVVDLGNLMKQIGALIEAG